MLVAVDLESISSLIEEKISYGASFLYDFYISSIGSGMTIFLVVELILLMAAYAYKPSNRDFTLLVCFLALFVTMGLHDGQENTDFPRYILFFTGEGSNYGSVEMPEIYHLEWPYFYFCKTLRIFGRDPETYILGIFAITAVPFLYLTSKKSANPALTVLLLYIVFRMQTYQVFLCAHRQIVATLFLFLAYIAYDSNIRGRYVIAALCVGISLLGHSSMYLVVPIMAVLLLWNFKLSRNVYMIAIGVSFVAGLLLVSKFADLFHSFFFMLQDTEEVSRTAYYATSTHEDYQLKEAAVIFNMLPISALAATCVWFAGKEEMNSFFVKCLVFTAVVFNLFSFVPLAMRICTSTVLFGLIGGMPKKFQTDNTCRIVMMGVIALNFFFALRTMTDPGFRLVYHTFLTDL